MVAQCLLVSMGAIETNPNLGTVVGYGSPLQGGCLEGFDFLGLHQILYCVRLQVRSSPFQGD